MYATSRPRTSRYHRIALCRSATTIAIVSIPRIPMFSRRRIGIPRYELARTVEAESLFRGTVAIHLGVPLHNFVIRDALDLLLHRELVFGLPQVDDPAGGLVALELRHDELPLPTARLERGDHLGAVEDDVAIAHVELRDDRLAQIQEQVVHRREHELAAELELSDAIDVVLQDPHHRALAAGQKAFREPALPFELPEALAGLPHVVFEPCVGREGFRRRHAQASNNPTQDLPASLIPADLQIGDEAIAIIRVPRHVEALIQVAERGRGRGSVEVREDEEPLAGNWAVLLD